MPPWTLLALGALGALALVVSDDCPGFSQRGEITYPTTSCPPGLIANVLCGYNRERAKQGLDRLSFDPALASKASIWAQTGGHYGFLSKDPFYGQKVYNYSYAHPGIVFGHFSAEDIFADFNGAIRPKIWWRENGKSTWKFYDYLDSNWNKTTQIGIACSGSTKGPPEANRPEHAFFWVVMWFDFAGCTVDRCP